MARTDAEPIDGQPLDEARDEYGREEMLRRLTTPGPSGWIGWYLKGDGWRHYFDIEFWRTRQGRQTLDTGGFLHTPPPQPLGTGDWTQIKIGLRIPRHFPVFVAPHPAAAPEPKHEV